MTVVSRPAPRPGFLVYAQVAKWQTVPVPDGIRSLEQLESFLQAAAKGAGLDMKQPFPFRVTGSPGLVKYHVVNFTHHGTNVHLHVRTADDKEIAIHDAKGQLLARWPAPRRQPVTFSTRTTETPLAFTSDSRTLIFVHDGGEQQKPILRRWDVGTRRFLPDVELPEYEPKNAGAFSCDGRTLAIVPNDYDATAS